VNGLAHHPRVNLRGVRGAATRGGRGYTDEAGEIGTDREISASFNGESSATQVDRVMCGKVRVDRSGLARREVRRATSEAVWCVAQERADRPTRRSKISEPGRTGWRHRQFTRSRLPRATTG
jgi:hypothetical protein